MVWYVVVLVTLSVLAVGALVARKRARTMTERALSSIPRADPYEPTSSTGSRATEGGEDPAVSHSCPVCLAEYSASDRFCARDGAPLVDSRTAGPFASGMICPTCRRGYPSDASYCPEDADQLVPYGLFGASTSTPPPEPEDSNKICPECGVRHTAAHSFCCQDGAELVVVN